MQLYRDFTDKKTEYSPEWNRFARQWQRPPEIRAYMEKGTDYRNFVTTDEKKIIEEIKRQKEAYESKAAEYDEDGNIIEMDICDAVAATLKNIIRFAKEIIMKNTVLKYPGAKNRLANWLIRFALEYKK